MFMLWIRENNIILIALFISLLLHSVIMFYHNEKHIVKENIVTFEIIKQVANTQISENIMQNEVIEEVAKENNIEDEKEEIKKEVIEEKAIVKKEVTTKKQVIKKETVKKREVAQKKEKKEEKPNSDTVKSTGINEINNQAETYIKQNYNQIEKEIVSRIIYPPRAKKLGIEGAGYLLISIDKTGAIVSVQAYDFPNKLLQDAALKAAKKVGYIAGHGMVSNVEVKVPVKFYLR